MAGHLPLNNQYDYLGFVDKTHLQQVRLRLEQKSADQYAEVLDAPRVGAHWI